MVKFLAIDFRDLLPSNRTPVAEGLVSSLFVGSTRLQASVCFAVGVQVVVFIFHGGSVCCQGFGRKPEIFQIQGGCV